MRLTKQTGHAIRILIDCALAGDALVKIAPLAERLDITRQNAFKIVHLLSRAGFVTSVRGPAGGIRLARPADAISIADVVASMEETNVEVAGTQGDNASGPKALSAVFGDALAAFISVLEAHTIADLAFTHRREGSSKAGKTALAPTPTRKVARKR